jgi:hypothetical protein
LLLFITLLNSLNIIRLTIKKENTMECHVSEKYEVITYEDIAVFNYSLPETEEQEQIEREITLVWEDTLENFFETYTSDKPYKIHSFITQRQKEKFVDAIEAENENIIDEVDEEIGRKMKFSFDYTSPTYED